MASNTDPIQRMLTTEDAQFSRLHRIVEEAMREERSLTRRVEEEARKDVRTRSERLADGLTDIGGSWAFILFFIATLVAWIVVNVVFLAGTGFDPYPFIFLNLVLSCISALQAPVVLMSQNRQEARDRARAEKDYLINLRAELEIRSLHRKLDLSMEDHYKHLCAMHQTQIELLQRLVDRLENPRREPSTDLG
jgi:uncharacterized membrane protein